MPAADADAGSAARNAPWCQPPCPVLLLFAPNHAALLGSLLGQFATAPGVAAAGQCLECLPAAGRWSADVKHALVLIDAKLLVAAPGDGIGALMADLPLSTRVIVLLGKRDGLRDITSLVFDRVRGCFPIDAPAKTYLRAIDVVSRGELWFPRWVLAEVIDRSLAYQALTTAPVDTAGEPRPNLLNPREQAVVTLVRQGLTNKEIARRLDIRPDTVKKYLSGAFEKFGVRNRLQLIARQPLHSSDVSDPPAAPRNPTSP